MATPQISTVHTMLASARVRPRAYASLIKPDVTFLVVLTTVAGFYMASTGPLDRMKLLQTLMGTTLVAAGTAALNHFIERREDAVMRRTARRPLPLGILQPLEALIFGVATVLLGLSWLAWKTNGLASLIALATCASYLGIYTPLKKYTPWATAIGAFPGALPPLIGWAAARGSLGLGAWVLFGILFFWQFPHFLAIAWIYREDYARAGIRMLPVVDRAGGSTYAQIVVTSAILVPVSLLPTLIGMVGTLYFFLALLIGMALMVACLWAAREKTNVRAKWLMHATVIHIPVLLGLLMLDKLPR
jgi:protoheme IX farnesyltransferase